MSSSTIAGADDARCDSASSFRLTGSLEFDLGVKNSNAVITGLRGGLQVTLDDANALGDFAGDLREVGVDGEFGCFEDLPHIGEFKIFE